MCSLTTSNSNLIISRNRQYGREKCGDVSISPDVKFLTLHCIFCEFDDEKLDTFLNHLQSEHLKILNADVSWLGSVQDGEEEVLPQVKLEETEVGEDDKDDPLMPENNPTDIKSKFIENDNELSISSFIDENTKHSHSSSDEESELAPVQVAERPKDIHIFKLIEHYQQHPTLWNSRLRNRYIRTERQQAYKGIAKKMLEEFPNVKIDYQYVLVKISKLKKLYFSYNENDPKLTKNEKKFYEKLHFLKDHPPNKEKKKKCLLCHKEVFDLPRHVKNHDENEKFQTCNICSEIQPSERHLKMHLRSAHRRYECEYCDVVYVALNSLNNHIRKKHSDKPQPPIHPLAKLPSERICEYCGRQFASKQVLNKHKRFVHLQQRPYACSECSKTYKAKDKLQSHINSAHLNVRPHVCDTCSRGFFDKKTLKQHMRTHNKA